MPYLLEGLSPEPGDFPLIYWLSEPPGWTHSAALGGSRLPAEAVPREAALATAHPALPDFVLLPPALGVSPAFREIVEALEPGIHQFFPVTLTAPGGEPAGRQYDLFNVVGRLDAVIENLSEVERRRTPFATEVLCFAKASPRLTLDARRIAGRHVWRGDRHFRSSIFFSDAVARRIEALGLRSLELVRADQV